MIGRSGCGTLRLASPLGRRQHLATIRSIVVKPDGTSFLVADQYGQIRLWGLPANDARMLRHGANWVTAVGFSSDGKTVLTAGGNPLFLNRGFVWLWDRVTCKELTGPIRFDHPVLAASLSPDGTRLLTGYGDPMRGGGASLRDIAQPDRDLFKFTHEWYPVWSVAFSPDGQIAATASYEFKSNRGDAKLWDAATGQFLQVIRHPEGGILAVAFSPDGKTVLTGGYDHTARFWNVPKGQPVGPILSHPKRSSGSPSAPMVVPS